MIVAKLGVNEGWQAQRTFTAPNSSGANLGQEGGWQVQHSLTGPGTSVAHSRRKHVTINS